MSADEWEPYYAPDDDLYDRPSMLVVWAFVGLVMWSVIGLVIWWAVSR